MTTKVHQDTNEAGERVYTLCGVNACCPTVTLNKGGDYVLKDDFGGSVILSKEQFKMLKDIKD